jgi:hydroxyacylglutathione hydrolase
MHHWTTHSKYIIYRVLGFRCNVFLLTNGINNLLIDCGSKRYRRQLIWSLARLGISHIDALILTHSHFDHAGNAHYIQNRFGATVIIHESESHYLKLGNSPLPEGTNWLTRIIINTFGGKISSLTSYEPCKANMTIKGNYLLDEFGFNGYILETPGHSKGSVSIVVDDEIVLAGDAMFGVFPGSIFPPFADDVPLLIHSWKILLNSGAILFFPSHGQQRHRETVLKQFAKYSMK